MASQKKKRKSNRRRQQGARRTMPVTERPSVHEAVASKTSAHQEALQRIGEAGDRFAALMAKAYTTEVHDRGVMHQGTLTAQEHAELLTLAPEKGREYGAQVEAMRDRLVEIAEKVNPLNL